MKLTNLLFIVAAACLSYCCSSGSSSAAKEEQAVEEEVAIPETFSFKGENELKLKEQLFIHLREKVVDIDGYTFVKFEELILEDQQFEYKAVIIDRDMINPLVEYNPQKANIVLASYQIRLPNEQLGDTVTVKGSIEVSAPPASEARLTEVQVQLTADFSNSYLAANSYEGPTRILETSNLQQELIVKLDEPRIYPKTELYLKARVMELTESDLAGMTKEEMAYLRNEIFARHGHTFKTDRMKSYFYRQSWYLPSFHDATAHLNETEKKNVQFIKSMES